MSSALDVYLYNTLVGQITQDGRRTRFTPSNPGILRWGRTSTALSHSLPLGLSRYNINTSSSFFDGVIPEGSLLLRLETQLKNRSTYGVLERFGGDVAGAVVIVPEGDPVPDPTSRYTPISEQEIAQWIRNPAQAPLGNDEDGRHSIPGVQNKFVLARLDEQWMFCHRGAASTHIFKPPILNHRGNSVACEFLGMSMAQALGLTDVEISMKSFEGEEVFITSRYDRSITSDGEVQRVHQEDMCQALGVSPSSKYQSSGGPSLQRIARLLSGEDQRRLLRMCTLNVVLGNTDAHARNHSLLHHSDGASQLAPAYDLLPFLYYGSSDMDLALYINNKRSFREGVLVQDLIDEASKWSRTSISLAETEMQSTLSTIDTHLDQNAQLYIDQGVPPQAVEDVFVRVQHMLQGKPGGVLVSSGYTWDRGTTTSNNATQLPAKGLCLSPTVTGEPCQNPAGSCPFH